MTSDQRYEAFRGAQVAITGGLGFIGSSLARRLSSLGSNVLVIDNRLTGSGANFFNLHSLKKCLTVVEGDIREADLLRQHLQGRHYLFNLAAHNSHQTSMTAPLLDLDINCRAQLGLLEICRVVNPSITIVFASTRQVYGRPRYLPVDEKIIHSNLQT